MLWMPPVRIIIVLWHPIAIRWLYECLTLIDQIIWSIFTSIIYLEANQGLGLTFHIICHWRCQELNPGTLFLQSICCSTDFEPISSTILYQEAEPHIVPHFIRISSAMFLTKHGVGGGGGNTSFFANGCNAHVSLWNQTAGWELPPLAAIVVQQRIRYLGTSARNSCNKTGY